MTKKDRVVYYSLCYVWFEFKHDKKPIKLEIHFRHIYWMCLLITTGLLLKMEKNASAKALLCLSIGKYY